MPNIKFTVETQATIKRLELDEYDHYTPINLNNGVGTRNLASGYVGVAILYLRGLKGQTGKLTIVQKVGAVDVILAKRNVKITSDTGEAISHLAFQVQ